MALKSTGNFIMIGPHEDMKNDVSPIAIFNIVGIKEEDTTKYFPIMSNFYDTASWPGTGNALMDVNDEQTVPPQALQYCTVNKINYGGTIYWLSNVNTNSLTYRSIENNTHCIRISTTDDWNTYTVRYTDGSAN